MIKLDKALTFILFTLAACGVGWGIVGLINIFETFFM